MGKGNIKEVKLYAECYMDLAFLLFILYYNENGNFERIEEAHKRRKFKICGKVYELNHSEAMGYAKVINNVKESNYAIGFIDAPKNKNFESGIRNLLEKMGFTESHNKFGVGVWMATNGGKVLILNRTIEIWLRGQGLKHIGENDKITDVRKGIKLLKNGLLEGNALSKVWQDIIDFFTKEIISFTPL